MSRFEFPAFRHLVQAQAGNEGAFRAVDVVEFLFVERDQLREFEVVSFSENNAQISPSVTPLDRMQLVTATFDEGCTCV